VRVLRASPDRVPAPCPHAGPGSCGGCDWQHATGEAQRRLKAAVVREQLARLAGLSDVDVVVAALPGGRHGELLGWRTRVRFAVTPDGRAGLRRHRSHQVEPIEHCPLTTDQVDAAGVGRRRWPGASAVQVVASTGGDRTVVVTPASRQARPDLIGPAEVAERAAGRSWRVAAAGFWQVHPAAADALAGCVRELLAPRPGEVALDLYAGAGLFAGVLAEAVGERGQVLAVESDRLAARDATANLADLPQARVLRARVTAALLGRLPLPTGAPPGRTGPDPATPSSAPSRAGTARPDRAAADASDVRAGAGGDVLASTLPRGGGARPDVAVLDPPRRGAGPAVVAALLALRPRAVAYAACDPAALARDLRAAVEAGYRLADLRAFDLFPMTHHVECVALLTPDGATAGCPTTG